MKNEVEYLQTMARELQDRRSEAPAEKDSYFENRKAKLNTEIHKREIERLNKEVNSISSQNTRIRLQVLSLRKERTLFDQIFKNLESQILEEECKLLCLLEKGHVAAKQLKEAQANFANVVELIKRSKAEDFKMLMRQEEERYKHNLSSVHMKDAPDDADRSSQHSDHRMSHMSKGANAARTGLELKQTRSSLHLQREDVSARIGYIENFLLAVRLETGEPEMKKFLQIAEYGNSISEKQYQNFQQLQAERLSLEAELASFSENQVNSQYKEISLSALIRPPGQVANTAAKQQEQQNF